MARKNVATFESLAAKAFEIAEEQDRKLRTIEQYLVNQEEDKALDAMRSFFNLNPTQRKGMALCTPNSLAESGRTA